MRHRLSSIVICCDRLILLVVGVIWTATVEGAATVTNIHADPLVNTSCDRAFSICGSTHFTYAEEYEGCLWFKFELEETQHVHIEVPGYDVYMYVPGTGPCVCDAETHETVIDEVLVGGPVPGLGHFVTYAFAVEVGGGPIAPINISVVQGTLSGCVEIPCEGCLPSFSPLSGMEYIISAWTKEEGGELGALFYEAPRLRVQSPPGTVLLDIAPDHIKPIMVEGWQLMEASFSMPLGGASLVVSFASEDATDVLFDDVRIFPADGSMKCYVYDPENLRFVAELDERHFATLYEYDNEGKLVRVKKETERGIRTLKETRQSSPRVAP